VSTATAAALAALPPDAKTQDLSGHWIVPGLIDAHVHAESDADLEQMLRWGVTSVRLMAEDVVAARRLAESSRTRANLPEVFPAAPIFTARGGWWDQGEPPDASLDRFPQTAAAGRQAVRKAKAVGAREIKLMLDDMGWCRDPRPRLPRMKPEVAKALIGEARREGLRATVHAPNLSDAREAIDDGATALAHGVLDPIGAETIRAMSSRPAFYIPTLDIFEFLADTRGFVDSVLADPRASAALLPDTVALYRSAAYSDRYRERYPNFENVKRHLPALRENLVKLHGARVPVALGTDMWAFPGLAVSIEMDLYVKAGLSPLETLRAATETAARSLSVEKDRGTLAVGKRADFLVLDADPLEDVKNLRAIAAVYKAGRRVAPVESGGH
jgi:imidazolonepropionase-like amidohydrolase